MLLNKKQITAVKTLLKSLSDVEAQIKAGKTEQEVFTQAQDAMKVFETFLKAQEDLEGGGCRLKFNPKDKEVGVELIIAYKTGENVAAFIKANSKI